METLKFISRCISIIYVFVLKVIVFQYKPNFIKKGFDALFRIKRYLFQTLHKFTQAHNHRCNGKKSIGESKFKECSKINRW